MRCIVISDSNSQPTARKLALIIKIPTHTAHIQPVASTSVPPASCQSGGPWG